MISTEQQLIAREILARADWRSLELLCLDIFVEIDYHVLDTGPGPDGGIDLECRSDSLSFAVQCKRWKCPVGISELENFEGALNSGAFQRGVFITTGTFKKTARQCFGKHSNIELVDGNMLDEGLRQFPIEKRALWFEKYATGELWDVPSCASCHSKMIPKQTKTGRAIWGCPDYGKCRGMLQEEAAFPIEEHHWSRSKGAKARAVALKSAKPMSTRTLSRDIYPQDPLSRIWRWLGNLRKNAMSG